MLAAIILAPLVGAAILGLFGKRMGERLIGLIACSTVAVSANGPNAVTSSRWSLMHHPRRP